MRMSNRKRKAEDILIDMIHFFQEYLDAINDYNDVDMDFLEGEKFAYVECLEMIQEWEKADEYGLDYDIEEKYPVR